VGEALGVPGIGGHNAGLMARSELRILALVTEAFGGRGGIAQYNRDFLAALAKCDQAGKMIVLPRFSSGSMDTLPTGVEQLRSVESRYAYSLTALWTAIMHRPIDFVFCGHLRMAPLAAGISRALNVPLWIQVHGVEVFELSALQRRSVESATMVTVVSRYTRRRLLQWVRIDPARVKVLANTVGPRYRPGPKPDYLLQRHAAGGKKVLMTVSRLDRLGPYKGHDRVIRTLPRVLEQHDTIYLIVGEGDDRPRLESLAVECGVAKNVQFTGSVPTEELPDYYRLADVFVMPSAYEGFGIVFLEAMATGLRVIAGSQDGSRDALCDGALGTLIDPENGEELASAILAALDNPARTGDRTTRFKPNLFRQHLNALHQFFLIQKGDSLAVLQSEETAITVPNPFPRLNDQQCR
jgi:phosphatidylinositol alpha-1,6-mannosyltransferase